MFSNRHELRGVELPSLSSRALVSSLKNTVALDWCGSRGVVQLYWTDVLDDNIYRGTLTGDGACSKRSVLILVGKHCLPCDAHNDTNKR